MYQKLFREITSRASDQAKTCIQWLIIRLAGWDKGASEFSRRLKLAWALLGAGLIALNGWAQIYTPATNSSPYYNFYSYMELDSTVPYVYTNSPTGLPLNETVEFTGTTNSADFIGSEQASQFGQVTTNSINVSVAASSSNANVYGFGGYPQYGIGGALSQSFITFNLTQPCCYTLVGNISGTTTGGVPGAVANVWQPQISEAELELAQVGMSNLFYLFLFDLTSGVSSSISTSGFMPSNVQYFVGCNITAAGGTNGSATGSASFTLTVYPTDTNCIYALSDPGPLFFLGEGGSSNIAVTSVNGTNCTWTATSDSDWLTITSGSAYTGSQTVSYTVSGDCGSNRAGTLTIAGQPVPVNQNGVSINYSSGSEEISGDFFLSEGGTNSLNVFATSNCIWTATSDSAWLTIVSGASGTGNGTVTYAAAPNESCSDRTGTLTVAGLSFPVLQYGVTNDYSLAPTNAFVDAGESFESVDVTAPATNCTWTAVSDVNWITITSGNSGTGNGTVTYSVQANDKLTEAVGTLTIAGIDFDVTQAAGTCGFTLDPSYAEYGYEATNDTVDVQCNLNDDCPWTASSGVSWITITSGSSGNGDGTVGYSVAANPGTTTRQGTLTIAGQPYSVSQDGVGACTFSVSPTRVSFDTNANNGIVGVTAAGSNCAWSASANASWLGISSAGSGTNSGSVAYNVAANTTTNWRSGTLTVAGRTVTISQAGLSNCTSTVTVSASPPGGGTVGGGAIVGCGSNITVRASANTNYYFTGWSAGGGSNVNTSSNYTFLVNGNTSLTANFATGPVIITTNTLPAAAIGSPYAAVLQAANGTPPYTWAASNGLPPGLSLGLGGAITGIPTAAVSGVFAVVVTDSNQLTATQTFNLTTSIFPLQITTSNLPGATQNAVYSTSLAASGGRPPYSWSLAPGSAGLPDNLALSPAGLISGVPGLSGTSEFLAQVNDSSTNSVQQLLSLTVIASTNAPIVPLTAPTLKGGGEFQFNLTTVPGVNYTVQKSSDLKNWTSVLTFSGSGGQETVDNLTASNGTMFYRVMVGQ